MPQDQKTHDARELRDRVLHQLSASLGHAEALSPDEIGDMAHEHAARADAARYWAAAARDLTEVAAVAGQERAVDPNAIHLRVDQLAELARATAEGAAQQIADHDYPSMSDQLHALGDTAATIVYNLHREGSLS